MTATEIRVAVTADGTTDQYIGPVRALFDYFNSRFELYGRRLVPVFVPAPSGSNAVALRASAASVAAQNTFAALEPSFGAWDPAWFNELARQGVVSITANMWSFLSDRETYDALHPYVWAVHPSMEQVWTNLASFACTSLAGRPAKHGGAGVQNQTRKFGILVAGRERLPSVTSLVGGLNSCGADVSTVNWASRDGSAGLTTAVNRLRSDGVTTFICACANQVAYSSIPSAFDQAGWEPEWLYTAFTSPVFDEYLHEFGMTDRQRAHLFTLQPLGVVGPEQSQWWWMAMVEAGVVDVKAVYSNIQRVAAGIYEQLLVLASGIQAAGPQLSADTFGQGLMSAQFPNTGAGQPPYRQPSVGFGPGDHSFESDYALAWWSAAAEPFGPFTDRTKGSWCYVQQGARFSAGNFPTNADDLLFDTNQPCR